MFMKNILITIVSEQTIPNVLFIKEMQHKVDRFLFISTPTMETRGKTNAIITACHLSHKKTKRIVVSETKPSQMSKQLREWIDFQYAENHFLVNLTGGTKMMALAIHSLFKSYSTDFYYLPIGKNSIIQVLDNFEEVEMALVFRLSLHEYLKANGLQYSVKTGMMYTREQCNQLFFEWKKNNFQLASFPLQLANKITGLELHWENAPGEWFEEFIFYEIREKYSLTNTQISASVMIFTDANSPLHDNEFDVMWVHENELFVAECKVALGKVPGIAVLKPLYKLSALSKNFGLKTNSYLHTLSKAKPLSDNLKRKLKILNISDIIDYEYFNNINS